MSDSEAKHEPAGDAVKMEHIVRIQSIARRYRERKKVVNMLLDRFEKIYDMKRNRFYYYDTVSDTSSWRKHVLFGRHDITKLSPIYTSDTGALMIQKHIRKYLSLMRVRLLYQQIVSPVPDARTGGTYYYNSSTGQAMWELPKFMKGKLTHKRRADRGPGEGSDSDVGGEEGGDDSDGSDSEAEKLRRKLGRKFPRSKIQELVDAAEDDWNSREIHLDVSGFNTRYVTSRIFDIANLHTLNLSGNRLHKLSDQIAYLSKLQVLNIRSNRIKEIPKEIEDLKFLRVCLFGYNLLTTLPGTFFLLGRMQDLELAGNPMGDIPVITGNMQLLKVLKEWDVGVCCFKQLKLLNCAKIGLKLWPPQIDRVAKLEHLDLSYNALTRAPESLARNNMLTYLDLSHNELVSLPAEIYVLPLQVLKVNNNKLTEFPDPSDLRTGSFTRGEHLVELDVTENSISEISAWIQLYRSISRLYASENRIMSLSRLMGENIFARELDLSRCMLFSLPSQLGQCTLLVKLYLDYNQLSEIPIELGHCHSMEELRLSHNVLPAISGEIFKHMKKLRVLTLENNSLTELPVEIYSLSSLFFLDISRNKIVTIAEEIRYLVSLETFLASENRLETIPMAISQCSELKICELHANCLVRLPPTLGKLPKLRRFTIHDNQLGPTIPAVLSEMKSLPAFDISYNNIPSKVKKENIITIFSSSCSDLSIIKQYIAAVWVETAKAASGTDLQGQEGGSFQTIGNVCSACSRITRPYLHSDLEGSFDMQECIDSMSSLVACIYGLQDPQLKDYIAPSRDAGETLHSLSLASIEFPVDNSLHGFIQNKRCFEYFSLSCEALVNLCNLYHDGYSKWKASLRDPPGPDASTMSPKKAYSSTKGKPKQVSFRRNFSSKRNLSESLPAEEETVHSESPSVLETNNQEIEVTANVEVLAAQIGPSMIKINPPAPPQSDCVPILSETMLRTILEQRQAPHLDNNVNDSRSLFPWNEDPIDLLISLMECYSGLGICLVRMSDFLYFLIRYLEERGSVACSCLSLSQRNGDDFVDLMGEKAAGFIKRKFKAPGSETKKQKSDDILAEVMMPSPSKMDSIDASDSLSLGTVDQSFISAAKEAEIEEDDQSTVHSVLDSNAAKRTITDIENNRRQLLLVASVFLEKASFILKCCGWDGKSMRLQNSAISSRRAVYHFEAMTAINSAIQIGYYYGRCLQKLRVCSTAIREFSSVLSLGSAMVWHPLQLEIIKCYIDMGEFLKADELLYRLIEDAPALHLRADKTKELGAVNSSDSNLSREVRMIGALLSSAISSLRSTGVGEKKQLNLFEMESSGVLHRRSVVDVEVSVGRTNRLLSKISEIRAKEKRIFAEEKLEGDRNEILQKVAEAKMRAIAIHKRHEEFLEEMGPIIMPE